MRTPAAPCAPHVAMADSRRRMSTVAADVRERFGRGLTLGLGTRQGSSTSAGRPHTDFHPLRVAPSGARITNPGRSGRTSAATTATLAAPSHYSASDDQEPNLILFFNLRSFVGRRAYWDI